jgi:tRNA pseudouridine38-40 synthase
LSQLPASQQRFAIGLEYDGAAFNGWQIQPHAPSVQQALNEALSVVAAAPVVCTGAGRTDTGVHASGQVAHFDASSVRSLRSWLLGVNSNLPAEISVFWIAQVESDFHARFSALSRSYQYVIFNRPVRSALERTRAWWVYQTVDHERMCQAAACLLGEHDFSSFRASSCQAHSAVRTIQHLSVERKGDFIFIKCRANAFLHHMVRNLVGSLVRVGKGEESAGWIAEILAARDRRVSGITAPACGLTLTEVEYPPSSFNHGIYYGNFERDT